MSSLHLARIYTDVNSAKPRNYWDYKSCILDVNGRQEDYEIIKLLGHGKYSNVFEAINMKSGIKCALKILKLDLVHVKREVKVLENLRGGTNIVTLMEIMQPPALQTYALSMEHAGENTFQIVFKMNDKQRKYYLYKLLQALDYAHSMGIMHRDVKPSNVLVNHVHRRLCLADWGLAEFYHPGMSQSTNVATRNYKAPEILINYEKYNYSMDIWSFGCIVAGLTFETTPFFNGYSLDEQLIQIVEVLGTSKLVHYSLKYKPNDDPKALIDRVGRHPKKDWKEFIHLDNRCFASPEALSLIDKLLIYDHNERLTAQEAMNHPYFKSIVQPQN